MFSITEQTATLAHINVRTERHGEEPAGAAEIMEGGSVIITFRVKCHPSGEQVKKLYEVLGNEITISITPAVDKQGSLGLNLEPEAA